MQTAQFINTNIQCTKILYAKFEKMNFKSFVQFEFYHSKCWAIVKLYHSKFLLVIEWAYFHLTLNLNGIIKIRFVKRYQRSRVSSHP